MSQLFSNEMLQKVEDNTRKELEEDCWRKLDSEEQKVYFAYYYSHVMAQKKFLVVRVIAILIFLVSVGELLFEMLCKNDPSFNPIPMWIGIMISVVLLFLNEVIFAMFRKKSLLAIKDCVYVTDALAYHYRDNKVQIKVNHKKINFQKYSYKQPVHPTDYAYNEKGKKTGFYIRLFVILRDGACVRKDVIGTEEYQYYLQKSEHMKISQAWSSTVHAS